MRETFYLWLKNGEIVIQIKSIDWLEEHNSKFENKVELKMNFVLSWKNDLFSTPIFAGCYIETHRLI